MNLPTYKTIALVFAVILLSSFQSNFANAQQSTDSNFAAKGKTAYSSHFPGIIIWTQIMGENGTFVFHGLDDELVVLRTTLTPSGECDQGLLCYDGTVNKSKNSQAIQVGDTFKITIDTATNTENVSFLSGFLENVDVKISLTKIKTKPISTITETEAKSIAEQAFIYAYPMLENYKSMYFFAINNNTDQYKGPFNVITNVDRLFTPKDTTVISPNSDTPYSTIILDLRTEPIVISVPKFNESRYHVFQLIDAYTYNFGYIGTRVTGSNAGNYLIVGPDWHGDTPKGIDKVIQSDTNFVTVAGRTQVFGPDDIKNVIEIQKQYKVAPLSQFLGTQAPTPAPAIDFPVWSADKTYSAEFINYLNLFMTWGPIDPSEKELFANFLKIGIEPGKHVDLSAMDPSIHQAIEEGVQSGYQKIKDKVPNLGEKVNGWTITNAFGSREFYNQDYLLRAGAAMWGIYANDLEEAAYPSTSIDENGEPLDASKHNYVIKFKDGLPPAKAFWSVTMYDGKTQLLVDNPIDRYRLGSTSELQKDQDGSIEIYIQHNSPGATKESNWLPAPNGPFYLLMRVYLPEQAFLNGTWTPPPVEKIYEKTEASSLGAQEAKSIAQQAFVYSYPMIQNYRIMYNQAINTSSQNYKAPFNVITNEERLATPHDTSFVTPNSDTLYSHTWFDLRAEPIIISVGKIQEDRFYNLQLVDSYTNNFAYIGTRTTGNNGGTFLLAGPNWNGQMPQGIDQVFRSESEFVYILGRTQVFGAEDLEDAIDAQKSYQIMPLSQFLNQSPSAPAPKINFPVWSEEKAFSGDFINYFDTILTWTKIDPSEKELFANFSKIGIEPGKHVDVGSLDPTIRNALVDVAKSGPEKIAANLPNAGKIAGDWIFTDACGNREFFGTNYLLRADCAMFGIYGNDKEEATYLTPVPSITIDASKHNYVLKFEDGAPPVKAFWSVTMYDSKTRLLVDNPLDRYLINSISHIKKNTDGSFEIYIQRASPGADKESNWLPSPDGPVYMILRMYLPDKTATDGTWKAPTIEEKIK